MVMILDEHVLEKFYERQVRQPTLMKNAVTLCKSDIVLEKKPRSHQKLGTLVNDIIEHQQQNMLIQKERSRDRAAAVYSLKGAEEKGKECRSWTSTGGICSFELDPAKKGKGKDIDQKPRFKERRLQKGNTPER